LVSGSGFTGENAGLGSGQADLASVVRTALEGVTQVAASPKCAYAVK
jgi:hypothetical protein